MSYGLIQAMDRSVCTCLLNWGLSELTYDTARKIRHYRTYSCVGYSSPSLKWYLHWGLYLFSYHLSGKKCTSYFVGFFGTVNVKQPKQTTPKILTKVLYFFLMWITCTRLLIKFLGSFHKCHASSRNFGTYHRNYTYLGIHLSGRNVCQNIWKM